MTLVAFCGLTESVNWHNHNGADTQGFTKYDCFIDLKKINEIWPQSSDYVNQEKIWLKLTVEWKL